MTSITSPSVDLQKYDPNGQQGLFIKTLGKYFKIVAVFTNDGEANDYMTKHEDVGLIAEIGSFLFLAKMADEGV